MDEPLLNDESLNYLDSESFELNNCDFIFSFPLSYDWIDEFFNWELFVEFWEFIFELFDIFDAEIEAPKLLPLHTL